MALLFTTREEIDLTNNPSFVYLGGVRLPADVIIGLDGDKVIAESKILDGVSVFERISRKPYNVNFEFTCREQDLTGKWVFPQRLVRRLAKHVWKPDYPMRVDNTFLNDLGIFYLVIQPITFTTIRGNTNVICSIKGMESPDNGKNYGTTLVIPL